MRLRQLRITLLVLFAFVAVGCSEPDKDEIKAAFLRAHPGSTVVDVSVGEGDGGTVYEHIRYRSPGSAIECEVVWGYQKTEAGWREFHRGEPGLSGTVCEGCVKKPCQ